MRGGFGLKRGGLFIGNLDQCHRRSFPVLFYRVDETTASVTITLDISNNIANIG